MSSNDDNIVIKHKKRKRSSSSESQNNNTRKTKINNKDNKQKKVFAVLLFFFSVFYALSLISYSSQDSSGGGINFSDFFGLIMADDLVLAKAETIQNWLGLMGAYISEISYQYTVGYSIILFPLFIALWAKDLFFYDNINEKTVKSSITYIIFTVLFASLMGAISLLTEISLEWYASVGLMISSLFASITGAVGAIIIFILGLLLTAIFGTNVKLDKFSSMLREYFKAKKPKVNMNLSDKMNNFFDKKEEEIKQSAAKKSETKAIEKEEVKAEEKVKEESEIKIKFQNETQTVSETVEENPIKEKEPENNSSFDEAAQIIKSNISKITPRIFKKKEIEEEEEIEEVSNLVDNGSEIQQQVPETDSSDLNYCQSELDEYYNRKESLSEAEVKESPQVEQNSTARSIDKRELNKPDTKLRESEKFKRAVTFKPKPDLNSIQNQKEEENKASSFDIDLSAKKETDTIDSKPKISNEVQEEKTETGLNINIASNHSSDLIGDSLEDTIDLSHSAPKEIPQELKEESTETNYPIENNNPLEDVDEDDFVIEQVNDINELENIEKSDEDIIDDTTTIAPKPIAQPKPLVVELNEFEDEAEEDELTTPLGTAIHDEKINYSMPPLQLLIHENANMNINEQELKDNAQILQEKLETFKIFIDNLSVTPGPVVTQYEFVPAPGIKISKIESLADDLAMALKARGIRIIAPIPGKGTVGIEIPNQNPSLVRFSSIVKSSKFANSDSILPLALGKTISGDVFSVDLAKMPHLLIAGATGSGKSVGINTLIASLLYKIHPSKLKFVIIDPKKVELSQYRRLQKHFLAKSPDIEDTIVTNPQDAVVLLKSVVAEMEQRYDLLASVGMRNIGEYNKRIREGKLQDDESYSYREMPYIVVIIDELADLMLTASKDVEEPITRIAQMARAVGIHLVIATQRPSVDVITGIIKANFPARMAYQVAQKVDSRTILDMMGAETLLGNGDMLVLPNGTPKPVRVQNAFISTEEVEDICNHIGNQKGYSQPYMLPSLLETGEAGEDVYKNDRDPLFEDAARLIVRTQQGSVSMVQRRLKVGYARAGRIIDELESAGVVGPYDGSKARKVLMESESELEAVL